MTDMPKIFTALILATVIIVGVLTAPTPAHAQTNNTAISSLKISTSLQKDGSIVVEQILAYSRPAKLSWDLSSQNLSSLQVSADYKLLEKNVYKTSGKSGWTELTSTVVGTLWQINYTTTSNLVRHNDRDQFFFKVFQTTGRTINNISAQFIIPADPQAKNSLVGNVYAIGGTGPTRVETKSGNELDYTLSLAGPNSLFTISASWSKDVLQLSKIQEWRLSIINMGLIPPLVLAVILPLLALIALLDIYRRQHRGERRIKTILDVPPSPMSPLTVGVMVRKKIYPEELAAMIIDLCHRGYLVIVYKGSHYFLGQRRPFDEHMETWERQIMEQIFMNNYKLVGDSLQSLTSRSLYSPKIRIAFSDIYQTITDQDFFVENPHLTRVRYKLFALAIYFASLIGMVWVTLSGSNVALLIPLVATMFIAYLIIRLSPQLIRYTPKGLAIREQWLSFGNYLSENEPFPGDQPGTNTFGKYLAYAVALNKVGSWARRFDLSNQVLMRPDWFVSYQDPTSTQFAKDIIKFGQEISKIVTSMRGPLVN